MPYIQKQQRRRYGTGKTTHTNYALYYHLTWAVEEELPLITKEVEERCVRLEMYSPREKKTAK